MIQYRTFCNFDPPYLAEIWNESFTGRGAVQLRNSSPFERHILAKLYFDPEGLIVAVDKNIPVGFVHAGFGPNPTESALAFTSGVTCLLAVRPTYRRRGIGGELLERSEAYLKSKGARTLFAGTMRPMTPFYLGLYGGCDQPGFLASDEGAGPFLEYQGYETHQTCLVFQRAFEQGVNVADGRFAALRRRYSMRVLPRTGASSWWQECVLGPLDTLECRLEETLTGRVAGRAEVWEMEGFGHRWGVPAAGILSCQIREDLRRQGLGKFLMMHVLRHLQEQYFGLVEVQVMERNQPGVKLFQSLGFEQVDFGRMYQKVH